MSTDTNTDPQDSNNSSDLEDNNSNNQSSNNSSGSNTDPVQKLVEEKVKEAIKDVKNKLDNAYNARDEALRKLAEIENFRKQEEVKRLHEEGKHREALELQLAEERAQKSAYEKRVVELTRDMELRNALTSYSFKNDNAFNMAYKEIVEQLTQDDKGMWKHKSGVPLKDFVRQFAESEENSFLIKPKVSSGGGSQPTSRSSNSSNSLEGKSIFSLSQDEVLKMAREGKLPSQRR
jgi:hypothetical protein